MGGEAWWAAVHGVAKSRTRLSDFTFTFHFNALEKEMATHSSVLAWRISGTEEPSGLPSMGSYIGQYTRLGSSRGPSCPILPPVATAPSKPRRPPGSQAPSHPRSRWNRRQHRKSRARGRSCPVPGCPALGPPESGGSGGRQTPLRRAGTCGGREGSEHGARPAGTGQGAVGKRLLTYA